METVREIVDFIEKERGERVPESRVKAWHKKGVLPRPERKFGGKTGSRSEYPEGTKEQAMIVYDKLMENKDFYCILMELFCEKRNVDIEHIKKMFSSFDPKSIIDTVKRELMTIVDPKDLESTLHLIMKQGPKSQDKDVDPLEIWPRLLFRLARSEEVGHAFDNRKVDAWDKEDILRIISHNMFNIPIMVHSEEDKPLESITKITGIPATEIDEMDISSQVSQIFNIKHVINIMNNLTAKQLETARDDFMLIKNYSKSIEGYAISHGVKFRNYTIFIQFGKEINNPGSPLFALSIIGLISLRKVYEPLLINFFKKMTPKQRKDILNKCNLLPFELRKMINPLISNTRNEGFVEQNS